jgi:crotonobetaine/carnitine-CoA ligase
MRMSEPAIAPDRDAANGAGGTWIDRETIRDIMDRRAVHDPDHLYCTFQGRRYTFGEVNDLVNRVANRLLSLGLRKGDPVAVMLPSHPDHVITILALAKTGLLRIPVNTNLKGASLDYVVELFRPRAIVADMAYSDELKATLSTHPVEHVIWRTADASAPSDFAAFLTHSEVAPPPVAPRPDDIIAIHPSSGTTGAPKGVLKSELNLRAGPIATIRLAGLEDGSVCHMWEPLHHGGGVGVVMASILRCTTLAMHDRFSASRFWDQVRAAGATHIHYLGSVVPVLLKQPPSPQDREHTARVAWGGGCPVEHWTALEDRFGVEVREGYGLSELTSFVTINTERKVGSIGKPLPFFDIGIFGETGDLAPGEVGEMRVRSKVPGLEFRGYYANPEASAATVDGEWLMTGDLASYDEDGFLYFKGRKKDVIRRRGVNIAAWEVERVIAEHPAVQECAVIAVPSPIGEDDLKLFIRRAPDANIDPIELVQWCEPRMPYFQIPRYYAFIEALPKTASERVKKNELSKSTDDCFDLEAAGYVVDRKKSLRAGAVS